eukprot:575646_1
MPRDKKKNQQTALLIWAGLSTLVVVGAYWYNKMKQKEQEEYPNKREQITYAGDSKPRAISEKKGLIPSIYHSATNIKLCMRLLATLYKSNILHLPFLGLMMAKRFGMNFGMNFGMTFMRPPDTACNL